MKDWQEYGLCRGRSPEPWFPRQVNSICIDEAKAVCRACPVQSECLTYGLEARLYGDDYPTNGELIHGIWGGATYEERIRIRSMLGGKKLADVRAATG